MIKIICLGSIKEKYIQEAIKEYEKRLSKYTKLEIIELKDEKDTANPLKKEKENILKHIHDKDNIVILDIKGQELTSEEFSSFINKELTNNSNITFIIGSSTGLDEEIKEMSNKKISFSKLTFPHQLFRVVLLEQIYRGFKIINNETYHK
ncbi:MAG: 23S rRNA (pseudouridine(1915)-N(3))-methyltransferase RlmH [Bacilli bacterium]|nr:23S rRNA (pseudouridine(1915)-N(3))-methyltransferase RlmH [Bacilli bacterium]